MRMSKCTFVLLILMYCEVLSHAQVDFTESNLPILSIETLEAISDDGKIPGTMTVYWNEDGSINRLTDTPTDYNGNIGIKLRGQSSLALYDKKSYSVETRDVLGEDNSVNLLGMPKEVDWVLHGPYGDKSLIRNALMYTLADSITPYAPRVQMIELQINSEYMGVYLFTEKIKRDDSRIDIAKLKEEDLLGDDLTGGYILKIDKSDPEEVGWISDYSVSAAQPTKFVHVYPEWDDIQPEQKQYIKSWIDDFEDLLAGPSFADPDIGYRQSINTESFIDFMLLNELSRNIDAYRLSTYMYKDKDSKDDELHVGPVWDYNLAFGNADYCDGQRIGGWAYRFNEFCPDDMYQVHFWWQRLLSDPTFAADLKEKWMKLRNGKFTTANIMAIIDKLTAQLEEPQQRNFERWDILGNYIWPNAFVGDTYASEIDYLKEWIVDRLAWMDEAFDIELGIEYQSDINLSIAPNPAAQYLNISTDVVHDVVSMSILNCRGIMVYNSNTASITNTEVDISYLQAGAYLLQIVTAQNVYVRKFIKI